MRNVILMALLWSFITMNTHSSEEILIIDVRTIEEWNKGHINAAKHIEWHVISEKIFDLTIGGFGLTGVILSAKIKLKKINSSLIDQKVIGFNSYDQFFAHSNEIKKYEYYVSWIQYFDNQRIKGLSYFGNHSKDRKIYNIKIRDQKLNLFSYSILKLFTQNWKSLSYF